MRTWNFAQQDADKGEDKPDDDADNGADAAELLHALAQEDPAVAEQVNSLKPADAAEVAEPPKPARCAIM